MTNHHVQYNWRKLTFIVLWLLVGTFGFSLMRTAPALLLPLTFKKISDSNLSLGILLGSIPALMNLFVNPVVSFKSDRTRTKWGRRRPYLFWASPFIAITLVLIGFFGDIMTLLQVPERYYTVIGISVLGLLIIVFQFFCMFVASVIYYYFVDVMPERFIGRFMALFNMVCALVGFIFSNYFLGLADQYSIWLYAGSAIIYIVCMLLMLVLVPEGDYPPVTDDSRQTTLKDKVRLYFQECFSLPFYICLFLALAINEASLVCRSLFCIFFAKENLNLTLEQFGTVNGYSQLFTVLLALPLGYLNDKIHPLKIFMTGGLLVIIVTALSFFFICDYNSFFVYTLLLSGAYMIQNASSVPLSVKLFPRSHYGQFGSAKAMLVSMTLIIANCIGGWFMDVVKDYRYLFVWDFVLTTIAMLGLLIVYKIWKRYGGEDHYAAPLNTGKSTNA